jgi:RNA polymerase sigma-70 factor (ECF subfamily)
VLKGFLRRFVSSDHDIEDICQETVTRALEAERSREIKEPRAFLFGVARNVVRKRLDKQSRSLIDFVDDFSSDHFESGEPSIEQHLDGRQRMLMFTASVATLPRQCQRVFILKKVYGYSHKEIAAKLEISVSTVEKHAAAGLKRCMDEMEKRQEQSQENGYDGFVLNREIST